MPNDSQSATVSPAPAGGLPGGGNTGRPTAPTALESLSLRELVATVWRRKLLLVSVVFVLTLIAAAVLMLLTPRYTAEALIAIAGGERNIVDVGAVVNGLAGDDETLASEIQVIRSRDLARQIVAALQLNQDAEFNKELREAQAGWRAWLKKLRTAAAEFLGAGNTAPPDPATVEARVLNAFSDRLEVFREGRSRVLAVRFTSKDPAKAARAANAVVDVYLARQSSEKLAATRAANQWLDQRVAELRQKAEESDTNVERFRQRSELLRGNEGTLIAQQFTELNTQLILAQAAQAEAEARLRETESLVSAPGGVASAGDVLNSELIRTLRTQEAELQRRVAELSTDLGRLHPRMVNLLAEVGSLQAKIAAEVDRIMRGLENEVSIARARQRSLQDSLDSLKRQLAKANTDEVKLRALEREAEANRLLLTTFLSRLKETSSQEDAALQQPDARIVSRADVPLKPSFPAKTPILALAVVGSGVLGLMLVFILEHFDRSVRSGEQIEEFSGIPSLGFVPLLRSFGRDKRRPADYVLEHPKSALAESINSLRWNLDLAVGDRTVKSILLTSAYPREGKTTIAACLARTRALAGEKVVLVDADCRMSGVPNTLGIVGGPGLMNALLDRVPVDDVTLTDDSSGMHVIRAGRATRNPGEALTSAAMDELLRDLTRRYDAVIVDAPPVMAASDALLLARRIDVTLFVVRWAETRREVIGLALKKLVEADARIAGVLLSMVDVRKYALYGYGDSGAYSGRLQNYYAG